MISRFAICAMLVLAACSQPRSPGVEPGSDPPAQATDNSPARLEAEARALANPNGCAEPGQCRTAPVGDRPCGGPRDYVVYCAATTDTAALFRKLEELRQAERELNQRTGAVSTCEYRTPPETELVAGTCRAVAVGARQGPR